MGGCHAVGCLPRFSDFLCLGGLQGKENLGAHLVVSADHGLGQHRDVSTCADSTDASARRRAGGNDSVETGAMRAGFLRRRIMTPILDLLRQGITPEKIALSVA